VNELQREARQKLFSYAVAALSIFHQSSQKIEWTGSLSAWRRSLLRGWMTSSYWMYSLA
jgi:uncharacterized protein YfaP (DUF2135 family)